MGGVMSGPMDKMMEKQQTMAVTTQYRMLQRQITMQTEMQRRMMAIQIARTRDLFLFFGTFYSIAVPALLLRARATKNPGLLAPVLPLTFVLAYQYDAAYGTKMTRIRAEAERILAEETGLVQFPGGVLKVRDIDAIVAASMEAPVLVPPPYASESAPTPAPTSARGER